jgi:glucose-1-phosphate thymidylyltransferase
VIDVEGWYDAGKLDTLLDTNNTMLSKGRARRPSKLDGSTIVDPVYIEDNVTLTASTIGPNVSIGAGTVIDGSEISHAIIGEKAKISKSKLTNSLIGDEVIVEGINGSMTVGDHSEVRSS